MAIPRKIILLKIAGKRNAIDFHLDKHIPELFDTTNRDRLRYWNREVSNLISEMEELALRLPKNKAIRDEVGVYRQRLKSLIRLRLSLRLSQLGETSL